jgi:hypothetical protein
MASSSRSPRQKFADGTSSTAPGDKRTSPDHPSSYADNESSPPIGRNETCHDASRDLSDSEFDDEDDRRVLRALAANDDDSDDLLSSDEATAKKESAETAESRATNETPTTGSLMPPNVNGKSLSASSASVLGKITSGLSAAFVGPSAMKRSPRVGVAPAETSPRPASSASTTRTPSPENFIWRPIKPGYILTDVGLQSRTIIQQTVEVEQTETASRSRDDALKQSIAVMPMPLAVVCCLLNFISPGLGEFGYLQ